MIGNDCMLGQIASFMESLGLSYDEVVYKIPYRNLLVMSKDKLRTCTGVKVQKTTGKDMAARRKEILKERKNTPKD